MLQVRDNETPNEWMKQIWERFIYFRKNDQLFNNSKNIKARKTIIYWNEINGFYKYHSIVTDITICFFCNQLVYTGLQTKNIGNYNYIGMEKHQVSHCTRNNFCDISYNELRVEGLIDIKASSIITPLAN
ncbi:hypothetical protein Glove_116g9 [Diversispora epigaea]|uniref:Uncharacterized protein n=1 Tax=Diversispora epigaea TaxID=1348612 RepID=A0A397JAY6_9GLOM|nr:hypothetical protein Glove_116g9 [Diversispora epigaea]